MDLDTLFGALRPPSETRRWENRPPDSLVVLDDTIGQALKMLEFSAQSVLLRYVAQSTNYLWVMDAAGAIWLAVEELAVGRKDADVVGLPFWRRYPHPADTKKLGHPTLVHGAPARIAGELALDDRASGLHWVLNAHSGRYCVVVPPSRQQVYNVAARFQSHGIVVEVDDLEL